MRLEFIVETANSSAESASPAFKCESDRQMKHSLSLSLSLYLSIYLSSSKMASDVAVATDAGRNGWRSKEDLEVEKLGQHLKDNAIDIFFSFFFFAPFFLFHKTNETCSFRPRIKRTTTATERRWSDVGKTNKKTTTK